VSTPTIAAVRSAVAHYYGMAAGEMVSPDRRRVIAHPRQLAMALARELTGKPLSLIGRHFGGRDHTTVIHAVRVVHERVGKETETRLAANGLKVLLTKKVTGC
jgi:chromosomal replication initiator protein